MRVRLRTALLCAHLLLAGCGLPRAPVADADRSRDSVSSRDSARCELDAVIAELATLMRSHLDVCRDCHDATRPESQLQDPGPRWLVGADVRRTFEQIRARRLIDASAPLDSALLLRPLAMREGGWVHKGGDVFTRSSAAFAALAAFVTHAASCMAASPSR